METNLSYGLTSLDYAQFSDRIRRNGENAIPEDLYNIMKNDYLEHPPVTDIITNYRLSEDKSRVILGFLVNFFLLHRSDISYTIYNVSASWEQVIVYWTYNGNSHWTVLSPVHLDGLITSEVMNDLPDNVLNYEELEQKIEEFMETVRAVLKRYLAYLELRPLEDDFSAFGENSESYKVAENTSRFSSAVWFNKIQEKDITLAGLGGIGSYTAFLLSRMQPRKIFLYDDDVVELANLSGQLFATSDIGTYKVNAVTRIMNDFSLYSSIFAYPEKFKSTTEPTDIMICGFDSIDARKMFFYVWKTHVSMSEHPESCLFIDGRLAAECFQVLCIRGNDSHNIKRYEEEFLFSKEEAEQTICSYKQTTYMANMIGSVMVNLFTNFVANEIMDGIRALPFYTEYNAETMLFSIN